MRVAEIGLGPWSPSIHLERVFYPVSVARGLSGTLVEGMGEPPPLFVVEGGLEQPVAGTVLARRLPSSPGG